MKRLVDVSDAVSEKFQRCKLLRLARVAPSIVRSAVIFEHDRHDSRTAGVRLWREHQHAAGINRGLNGEQSLVIGIDLERQLLRRLIGRPG